MLLEPQIDSSIGAPFDHDCGAANITAALPRSEALDPSVVSSQRRYKAFDHGDDLDSVAESEHMSTPRRRDLLWAWEALRVTDGGALIGVSA